MGDPHVYGDEMTHTLSLWINASLDTVRNCVVCLEEEKKDMGHLMIQLYCLKRHVDAMIGFLERQTK
jgi:hypothetical protein